MSIVAREKASKIYGKHFRLLFKKKKINNCNNFRRIERDKKRKNCGKLSKAGKVLNKKIWNYSKSSALGNSRFGIDSPVEGIYHWIRD